MSNNKSNCPYNRCNVLYTDCTSCSYNIQSYELEETVMRLDLKPGGAVFIVLRNVKSFNFSNTKGYC